MKRPKNIHGAGSSALTPNFSDAELDAAPEHIKREGVSYLLKSLHRRVSEQQDIIVKQQAFIEKCKRVIGETGLPLTPTGTTRPARKGQL